jgi:hypothetical protein
MSMQFDEIKTYTGVPLQLALNQMQQVLPPQAYTKVSGAGADLTDISPAYLNEKVTEIFGPCGIGWFYQIERDHQRISLVERAYSGGGGTYETWEASVDMLQLFYRFYDGEGNLNVSEAIISNGYSDNKNRGYALRGAITNAIGAGFAKLLWQLPVYKGIVDHKNAHQHEVGSIPVAAADGRSGSSRTTTRSAQKSTASQKAKTKRKTATRAKASAKAKVASKQPAEAEAHMEDALYAAEDYVIPEDHIIKKHRGYRMGGPKDDAPGLTPEAIAYYATNWKPSPDDEVGQTIVKYAGMLTAV